MKKVLVMFFVMAISIAIGRAYAEDSAPTPPLSAFVRTQTVTPHMEDNFSIDGGLTYYFNDWLAASSYLFVSGGWSEGYVGPVFVPIENIQLGVAVGAEQNSGQLQWRYGGSLWAGYEKVSLSVCFELNNKSFQGEYAGVWYDATLTYQPFNWLVVGAKDRRGVGFGPMVNLNYREVSLSVTWAMIAGEEEKFQPKVVLLGLGLSF